MNIKEMILKDNVKSDTIRLTSLCITNNKKKDNKVHVAGIINDTKTQKEKHYSLKVMRQYVKDTGDIYCYIEYKRYNK